MADAHPSGLSTPANCSDQEPAGDGTFSITRLSSAAFSGSNPSGGTRPSRGAANDFIDALLDSAPKSILELASEIMGDVGNSRALMPTDVAAAVGCVLIYYMGRMETVAFLRSLDDPQSASFMVALAMRTHADVKQIDEQSGYAVLPSASVRLTPPGARRLGAAQDLEKATRGISNGEIATEQVLADAAIAMTEVAPRLITTFDGKGDYSPWPPVPPALSATATTPSGYCPGVELAAATAALEGTVPGREDSNFKRTTVPSMPMSTACYSSRNTPLLSSTIITNPSGYCPGGSDMVATAALEGTVLDAKATNPINSTNPMRSPDSAHRLASAPPSVPSNVYRSNVAAPSQHNPLLPSSGMEHGHSHLASPVKPDACTVSPSTSPADSTSSPGTRADPARRVHAGSSLTFPLIYSEWDGKEKK